MYFAGVGGLPLKNISISSCSPMIKIASNSTNRKMSYLVETLSSIKSTLINMPSASEANKANITTALAIDIFIYIDFTSFMGNQLVMNLVGELRVMMEPTVVMRVPITYIQK
jgi:hypothetical protein